MDSSKLTALIERLEAALGPDRELDIAICLHLNHVGGHQTGTIQNLRRAEPDDDYLDYECYDDGGSIPECTDRAPELAGSLDAAIALVERVLPGWTIASIGQDDGKRWHVELRDGHRTSYSTVALSGAPTPAIALLIATLKALKAMEGRDGE